MIVRDSKFYRDDVETWLYRNISRYVFSRAKLEQFCQDDDLDAAIERALQMMHAFYVYILPFEDAEQDKLGIMDNVMKGAIVL